MHTVLVIGGYGFFGQRICASLAQIPLIRLLIGGRDLAPATRAALATHLDSTHAIAMDANDVNLAQRLTHLGVDTVIHTAGPFQGQHYSVARAAIDAGCNYIDLADGRQFVAGIKDLDDAARARGVTVVSGASSVPALSSAVVDRYLPQFQRLDSIRLGISSGARAPGLATVKGIFGYCGQPFQRYESGSWVTTHGWLDLYRYRFPAPLGSRLLGSCDVPDLELFPQRYPTVRTVTFHAGFGSDMGHLAVWGLAGLVKADCLKSALPFASPLNRISRRLEPFVSHRGGMFVRLDGTGHDGKHKSIAWHLLAANNHGPHIPCGAAIALAEKLARGEHLPRGAMPCVGLLTVDEYLAPLGALDLEEIAA
jgi:saccharopine dehydrogenase-like NADP-dependent oxidoreductase